MAEEAKKPLLMRIPASLLIAGGTASGYSLAYVYESRYLGYFHVPSTLVHIGVNTVIIAIAALASGSILTSLLYSYLLTVGLREDATKFRIAAGMSGFVTTLVFFVLVEVYYRKPSGKVVALTLAGIVVGVYVVRAAIIAIELWIQQRALKKPPKDNKKPPKNRVRWDLLLPVRSLAEWVGADGVMIAWILSMAYAVASTAGWADARNATEFLTLKEPTGYVVLRAYDDAVVAVSLNRATRTIGKDIVVISPKEAVVSLTREKLGPLKPCD